VEPLPSDWFKGLNCEVRHLPLEDHQPPDVASLEEAATFVRDRVREGKTVLVHCLAGEGRTGCVLAAYLIKFRGVSADEAINTLRRIKPRFVEKQQEKAVVEYGRTAKA
jgi:atypical dual specificity phosphatase